MTDIQQLSRWNRDVSRAIAALGTEAFFPALIDAMRGQVAIDYPQIWLYHRDLPPQVLYHEIPPAAVAAQVANNKKGYRRKRLGCCVTGCCFAAFGEWPPGPLGPM